MAKKESENYQPHNIAAVQHHHHFILYRDSSATTDLPSFPAISFLKFKNKKTGIYNETRLYIQDSRFLKFCFSP
jgi:hypothetical protein